MKKYAVIQDAKVINIIDAVDDYEPVNSDETDFILLADDDRPYIGYGYDAETHTFEIAPALIIEPAG